MTGRLPAGEPGGATRGGPKGAVRAGLIQKIGGGILVAAGVLGLLLPVLPGWVLIFAGLALMEEYRLHRWVRDRWVRWNARRKGPAE